MPATPPPDAKPPRPAPSAADTRLLQERVLYRDAEIIVLNKPGGLAVQGGTGTSRHLDGLLDALRFDAKDRPRLVHRLDKDTSGVLVLARTAPAAARLGDLFRSKATRKVYWAITVGAPKPRDGKIDQPLAKQGGPGGERVAADDEEGERALTYYRTVARAGDRFAWLALEPVTGRTHQLRVHCLTIGTPILGDGKYGGAAAHPDEPAASQEAPSPCARHRAAASASGKRISMTAPLPPHMRTSWDFFGFEEASERDPFADLAPEEMKRFYKEAKVVPTDGAFTIELDGKPLRTPEKRALTVPTAALARSDRRGMAGTRRHRETAQLAADTAGQHGDRSRDPAPRRRDRRAREIRDHRPALLSRRRAARAGRAATAGLAATARLGGGAARGFFRGDAGRHARRADASDAGRDRARHRGA